MSTDDITNALRDTLDDLADLASITTNSTQQQALRISAGRLIAQLQQQMDTLDYEHALFVCEITPTVAEHYKHIYLDAVREHVEVQA